MVYNCYNKNIKYKVLEPRIIILEEKYNQVLLDAIELSIVRFRTAIKKPLDTIFIFWAIGIGITVGANTTILAAIGSFVIGVSILFIQSLELFNSPYILIVSLTNEYKEELLKVINNIYSKYQIRNKSIHKDDSEYTFELRGKKDLSIKIYDVKKLME